jgi:arylformamidase
MLRAMDLELEYNNMKRVADAPAIVAEWAAQAARFRDENPAARLGVSYGVTERSRMDLFGPADAPVVLFIHGGYWQRLDRSWFSHLAGGLNRHGILVALPSYDLCPFVTLETIVQQMRQATAKLHALTGRRVLACGHSAGGHLTAMLMATDWTRHDAALPGDLVPAGVPISGVFDLAPLVPTTINDALRLSVTEAVRLSPSALSRPAHAGLHVVVGEAESGEFIRQSRDFARAWAGGFQMIDGADHFTVLAPLADPEHQLVGRIAGMARAIG